jgi:hypothetical protein
LEEKALVEVDSSSSERDGSHGHITLYINIIIVRSTLRRKEKDLLRTSFGA